MYSNSNINDLLKKKEEKSLIFIHTPKCGGKYVSSILSHLNIRYNGHKQAEENEELTFTVIRDPIERFESLLNYRLSDVNPRNDWPRHLNYVYNEKNISLNEIVSKMKDEEILGFNPYRTLKYWTTNVDIIITLENLEKLLNILGYTYDKNVFTPVNVSKKTRGKLNEESKNRIRELFNEDMIIYDKVKNSEL